MTSRRGMCTGGPRRASCMVVWSGVRHSGVRQSDALGRATMSAALYFRERSGVERRGQSEDRWDLPDFERYSRSATIFSTSSSPSFWPSLRNSWNSISRDLIPPSRRFADLTIVDPRSWRDWCRLFDFARRQPMPSSEESSSRVLRQSRSIKSLALPSSAGLAVGFTSRSTDLVVAGFTRSSRRRRGPRTHIPPIVIKSPGPDPPWRSPDRSKNTQYDPIVPPTQSPQSRGLSVPPHPSSTASWKRSSARTSAAAAPPPPRN